MEQDRNPYASPGITAGATRPGAVRRAPIASVPAEPELGVVDIVEQAASPARKWRLAFTREEAWLFVPDQDSAFVFTHAELAERGTIMLWGRFVALVVNGLLPEGRALAFRVDGEAIPSLRRWIHFARDIHVGSALKKRVRRALPLGMFATALALPILGVDFDPFGLVFGLGLIALAILAPRFPRPGMFVVDAVVWWALAASQGVSIAHGSKISIPFAVFALLFGRQSLRAYRFYR
jgi:hypothetical protein